MISGVLGGLGIATAAGAQAAVQFSTGDVHTTGAAPIAMLDVAPSFSGRAGGFQLFSAGRVMLGASGRTRSAFSSLFTTKRPVAAGVTPMVALRGQDDQLLSTASNRRVDGMLGVQIGSPLFGASFGIGAARSAHGTTSRTVQTTNADVHFARGTFQLRLGYTGSAFDAPNGMPPAQSGFSLSRTRFSDVTSDASWRFRKLEIGGFVGQRLAPNAAHHETWGGGFASVALNDRVAIVARQETAPSDPTRHLAAQQLTSIGFRIRPSLTRARFEDGSDAAQYRKEFIVTRMRGDGHGVRVYMPDAASVDIAGSFNEWTPAAMRSTGGGWWEVTLALPPGIHTLNIRADGGKWLVPFGLETTRDEFNGSVGVLNVPA